MRALSLRVEVLEDRTAPATLVAAYTFDEGTGTTVTDSSGNGNNGTITGATWTTAGKYGDALVFNGTNALVSIPDATSLHLTTGMTLEAWVNPSTVTSDWRDVIYKGNDNYWLEATSTSGGVPAAGATLGSSDVDTLGTAALTTNTWAFLTETYNGSTLALYVNGTEVSSLAHTGNIATSTNPLQIGGDNIYGQYFQGLIDNVRIYNTALTQPQIQTDMNTPVTSSQTSSIADLGFEQVSVGAGEFQYDPTGSPWAFSGSSGISGNNSGFTAGNPPAPQGSQVAFLQGTGSFTQSVTGWAAGSYVLTFDAAQRENYQASQQNFNVLVDGNVVGTFTPSGTSYQSFTTAVFTVTAGSHTIAFQGLDSAGGDNTAFIDQVAAVAQATIVPTVTGKTPAPNASNVVNTTAVTATFNESVQSSTVNTTNFTLKDAAGNLVSAAVTYTDSTHTATLTPNAVLADATTYTATISGVQDLAGNTMSPVSWSFTTVSAPTTQGLVGVFTYHNDNMRTGENLNETVLTPANVNSSTFGKLFSYPIDGLAIASPLYVAGVNIPGQGIHNVVYVATENDSVYAFDANGLSSTPLWHASFINPNAGITPVPAADTGETGDIPIEIGITGTPVIDPSTGTLYVVAATKEVVNGLATYVKRLHALDITTGAEKFGGPVVIQASVPGTGDGASGGQVPFNALRENQRTGLLLTNGVVYFGFASHGDNPPFHGWVLGYDATTLQQVLVYNDTANGSEGGIWMNGDGLATDSTGNLYFITGNGTFDPNIGGNAYGDSFVKMSPTGSVLDYFSPSVQSTLDANDLDLGSGGVLLLPDQSGAHPYEMVSAGKNGTIYLVDRNNMGQFNPNQDQIVQELVNIFPNNLGNEGGNFSSPVYFNGSVYFSPVAGAVQAFSLNNGLLSTVPTSQSSEIYNARGGTMAISANGSTNGILWTLQSTGSSSPGILHAYDATNLANELYNSNQAGFRDTLDTWLKFSLPVVANGEVFVASDSQLTIYGLLPNPPGGSSDVVASAAVQTQANTLTPVGPQVQNLQRLAAPVQHLIPQLGGPPASSSGSTQGFSLGVVPSQVPAFPGGPLAAAKTKPVVTHQVVNQPWINYRRSVVNDVGSVRRLNGPNEGSLPGHLG